MHNQGKLQPFQGASGHLSQNVVEQVFPSNVQIEELSHGTRISPACLEKHHISGRQQVIAKGASVLLTQGFREERELSCAKLFWLESSCLVSCLSFCVVCFSSVCFCSSGLVSKLHANLLVCYPSVGHVFAVFKVKVISKSSERIKIGGRVEVAVNLESRRTRKMLSWK